MSKRRPTRIRRLRSQAAGLRLAIDRRPPRWRSVADLGPFLIFLTFAALVGGFVFARSRMPPRLQAKDTGSPWIPGTAVRFGQDAPAPADSAQAGNTVEPDSTQVPAPEANGEDAARGSVAE